MPFGDIACRVVCLFLNIMEQDGICLQAVKKAIFKKKCFTDRLSRNHDPITQRKHTKVL